VHERSLISEHIIVGFDYTQIYENSSTETHTRSINSVSVHIFKDFLVTCRLLSK
jgi:hypothetical protein